jgi:hypothetical protein
VQPPAISAWQVVPGGNTSMDINNWSASPEGHKPWRLGVCGELQVERWCARNYSVSVALRLKAALM